MAYDAGGTLGNRIKKVREAYLGLDSARKLAALLEGVPGADHNSIGKYERDERLPNPIFLAAIVRRANINGHWLLTGQGDPNPPDPTTAERAFEGIRRIVQLADVAPDQLDRVLGSLSDWERFKRGGEGPP